MSTLDDKILGEKVHYYCSDSDEEEHNDKNDNSKQWSERQSNRRLIPTKQSDRYSTNTGPKGVLKDWQRYKQLEIEQRECEQNEKLLLMQKLSLNCRSNLDEERAKQSEQQTDDDIDNLLSNPNDPFLKQYMIKRMEEMMDRIECDTKDSPVFGQLISLNSGAEFLRAIDKEKKSVTVICHIFNDDVKECDAMNRSLQCLSQRYPSVKFCSLEAATAGMSKHFEKSGVPALLVYKDGNLLGNFVRLTDEFDENFYAEDVEKFLIEHGFLPDNSLVPQLIMTRRSIRESAVDEDSDSE